MVTVGLQSYRVTHPWRSTSGGGTLHSFVVVHYPQVPSFDYPNQVALVELDEGVRLVTNTLDMSRDALVIGSRVRIVVQHVDDALALPFCTPDSTGANA